ncbi:MAG: Si-specific NAD(P)(+) transhydrogenase [Gammaproteobacteria bacterium]|nr:Si-specific NAD(P)(+) transhydrogenase [Gammaproteobacteria bacterium]
MAGTPYDAVIIGSGPAGEGAAMALAKDGRRVAVVEAMDKVGGNCLHYGTIPSKALRHSVQLVADYRRHPLFRDQVGALSVSYPDLLRDAGQVTAEQVRIRQRHYVRNGVDLIHGRARLVGPHEVALEGAQGGDALAADHIILATGARPYHPPEVDFGHPRVVDSDTVLDLDHTPRSVTVFGAGVIGCEYASIFATLDLKVNLVNTRDRLLSFLDDEITDALSYHLRELGVVIRHNEDFRRVEAREDGVVFHCVSGKQFKTDILLWANGRSGNTEGLGLEALGIGVNQRGQVAVNGDFQTALPHIYAVGDVVGLPGLASASHDQGRFAASHILAGQGDWALIEDMPSGIYTVPEISCLGRTERELTADNVPYEIGQARFDSLARAQITGHTTGVLKILFHRETLEILGLHCFGEQAAEIVHIGQAVMSRADGGNTLRYFAETTFNYPTMAEAYRVAALNGLNRIF